MCFNYIFVFQVEITSLFFATAIFTMDIAIYENTTIYHET